MLIDNLQRRIYQLTIDLGDVIVAKPALHDALLKQPNTYLPAVRVGR